ncbi:hypothetical protein WJX84_002531 [Apatococcus fuscideae]|uniref:Uncharacterized protein n=1 Tax=Apatococcus fuscideae TaxID=2026836 RepID=A0AAW1T9D4_9CHLO
METRLLSRLSWGPTHRACLLASPRLHRLPHPRVFLVTEAESRSSTTASSSSSNTDALTQTLAGVSANEKRAAKSNNLMLGTHDSIDAWRQLDEQVNKYPDTRNFKAIGEGGDDFVRSMASAVEQVLGPLQQDRIRQRLSKKATYVSVTIGPVQVDRSDQVVYGFCWSLLRLRSCLL